VINDWNAVCRWFVNVPSSFAPNAGILSQWCQIFREGEN
jgi:hypothetical protein